MPSPASKAREAVRAGGLRGGLSVAVGVSRRGRLETAGPAPSSAGGAIPLRMRISVTSPLELRSVATHGDWPSGQGHFQGSSTHTAAETPHRTETTPMKTPPRPRGEYKGTINAATETGERAQ